MASSLSLNASSPVFIPCPPCLIQLVCAPFVSPIFAFRYHDTSRLPVPATPHAGQCPSSSACPRLAIPAIWPVSAAPIAAIVCLENLGDPVSIPRGNIDEKGRITGCGDG